MILAKMAPTSRAPRSWSAWRVNGGSTSVVVMTMGAAALDRRSFDSALRAPLRMTAFAGAGIAGVGPVGLGMVVTVCWGWDAWGPPSARIWGGGSEGWGRWGWGWWLRFAGAGMRGGRRRPGFRGGGRGPRRWGRWLSRRRPGRR